MERVSQHRGDLLFPPTAAAALLAFHLEVHGKEAIDEGVKARVEEAEEEEDVAEGRRHLLSGQHLWREPVPEAEHVVGCPTHNESQDDDGRHLQGAHARPGNVVVGAAKVELSGLGGGCRRKQEMREGKEMEIPKGGERELTGLPQRELQRVTVLRWPTRDSLPPSLAISY